MKIVSAVNAMIANSERIGDVIPGGNGEVFFRYGDKYNWSIKQDGEGVKLWFYPGNRELRELAHFDGYDWESFADYVFYSADDIGTREAVESFDELFRIVSEKRFGIDRMLDDIIDSADW
ncbi:hypothetical protein ROV96_19655 [Stenotrophomonas pavanii]|uniref:hypothetical protein n=1 Tax=Stenotrophomonas pavanii TaxID=487698 RepID=UPI0028951772|nr:hypothetical protein [Stenotrophomonas pavanii]MDT3457334.1 hypothetical protein [Stenotrophomonas pavanii]MDT3466154.1 hypothetical protein [Stenotrophomonas pavanii]